LLAVLCFAASAAHAEDSKPTFGDFGIDLGGRDLTARPQDDFFAYAGGSWLDEYEIPADLPGFGMFTRLALDSEEQIRVIIEEAAKSGAPSPAATSRRWETSSRTSWIRRPSRPAD
jgi:predicted metalloendopeptidase